HLRVRFGSAGQARIEAFAWGGRDTGWRDLARSAPVDVSRGEETMTWAPQNKLGGSLRDGTYVITVCRTDALSAVRRVPARPGPAEVTVVNPPWARVGCLPAPVVVRVRRLSAAVASTASFAPGSPVPLEIGTDKTKLTIGLERDAGGLVAHERPRAKPQLEFRLPKAHPPGLY